LSNTKIQVYLKEIIINKSSELDVLIKAIKIMFNHVHIFIFIFISCKRTHTIYKIINSLKGYSSFQIRKIFPYLKKYKALWTNSYFCETIGFISEKTIIKYIDNQKN